MVISCTAYGCKSKMTPGSGLHFFKFPLKNVVLNNLWIQAIRRDNFNPTIYSKLCSKHFTPNDYLHGNLITYRQQLKPDAVPTIFQEFPPQHQATNIGRLKIKSVSEVNDDKVFPSTLKFSNTEVNTFSPHASQAMNVEDELNDNDLILSTSMLYYTSQNPQENSSQFVSKGNQTKFCVWTESKFKTEIQMLKQTIKRKNDKINKLTKLFSSLNDKGLLDAESNMILDQLFSNLK